MALRQGFTMFVMPRVGLALTQSKSCIANCQCTYGSDTKPWENFLKGCDAMTWSRGGRAVIEVVVPSEGEPESSMEALSGGEFGHQVNQEHQDGSHLHNVCVSFACVASAPFHMHCCIHTGHSCS